MLEEENRYHGQLTPGDTDARETIMQSDSSLVTMGNHYFESLIAIYAHWE